MGEFRAVRIYITGRWRWGQVKPRKYPGEPILWSISQRGRGRLAWLNRAKT